MVILLIAQAAANPARVAVLGASGYTGAEVVRLTALHPGIKVTALTGEKQAGKVRRRGDQGQAMKDEDAVGPVWRNSVTALTTTIAKSDSGRGMGDHYHAAAPTPAS